MKNTTEFTPFSLETWVAALSVFDPKIVNGAVLEIGLGPDPFPDLGKVMLICDRMRRERAGTTPTDGVTKVSMQTIQKVAAALELPIAE